GVVQCQILAGQVAGGAVEAAALATVVGTQPQVQALGGAPVQARVGHVARGVGQLAVALAAFFHFAVGVGVVQRQAPAVRQRQGRGQFQALGGGFVDVDRLAKFVLGELGTEGNTARQVRVGGGITVGDARTV